METTADSQHPTSIAAHQPPFTDPAGSSRHHGHHRHGIFVRTSVMEGGQRHP